MYREGCPEDEHVEDLGVAHVVRLIGGWDFVDLYICSLGDVGHSIGVVDEYSPGLDTGGELIDGGLVEGDDDVVLIDEWGTH